MLTLRTHLGDETLDIDEFERRIRQGLLAPDTMLQFPAIAGNRWVRAGDLEVFRGLYDPNRIYFSRYFSLSRFPLVTTLLVLINFGLFLAMTIFVPRTGMVYSASQLVELGAKTPALIRDLGETWRLITANFIHRDWIHLAFNVLVLFNVGGALENSFRPVRFLAILLASALGTTLLSLYVSDTVSAGASGMVFGCLGGLVVFGIKYREIIPSKFRRFFGVAVAPYVLLFLWMGWVSTGVDNWGHLGGLIGGACATAFLQPRMLVVSEKNSFREKVIAIALILVVVGVVVGGPVVTKNFRRYEHFHDEVSGLKINHPVTWGPVVTSLGELGLGNNLPRPAWVQARFELVNSGECLSLIAERWLAEQVTRAERAGRVTDVRWNEIGQRDLAGYPAKGYEVSFNASGVGDGHVSYSLHFYSLSHGDRAYTLAVSAPSRRFRAYQHLFDEMLQSIELDEPRFLRRARADVLLRSGDQYSLDRLDIAKQRAGNHPVP